MAFIQATHKFVQPFLKGEIFIRVWLGFASNQDNMNQI